MALAGRRRAAHEDDPPREHRLRLPRLVRRRPLPSRPQTRLTHLAATSRSWTQPCASQRPMASASAHTRPCPTASPAQPHTGSWHRTSARPSTRDLTLAAYRHRDACADVEWAGELEDVVTDSGTCCRRCRASESAVLRFCDSAVLRFYCPTGGRP